MATLSAWKFDTLQGADEVLAKLEKLSREVGGTKPKTVVPPVWRFREGACQHELRP